MRDFIESRDKSTNLVIHGCLAIRYSRFGIYRSGMVSCPARGQLNRVDGYFSLFTPGCLVSQDRFGGPVPRQLAHSPHPGCIWCLLTVIRSFLPFSATTMSIHTVSHPQISAEFIGTRICVPMAFIADRLPAYAQYISRSLE